MQFLQGAVSAVGESVVLKKEDSSEKRQNVAKKAEIEIMEIEMLDLKGETRESALKAYQRLLRSVPPDRVYLDRSE